MTQASKPAVPPARDEADAPADHAPSAGPRLGERTDHALSFLGWLAVLALLVITVLPGLTGDKVFLGSSLLTDKAPWATAVGTTPITNLGVGDTVDSVAPTSIFSVTQARQGVLARWDPYISGGAQSLSQPNAGLLSPLSAPWWVLPARLAPAGVKVMEVAAIALGMQLLLRRRWRLPRVTAPVATLVFATSGFMLSFTNWPQTRTAAMLPLLLWATDRLAVGSRWRDALPMGVVVASLLLGGFPAVTVSGIYVCVAYFLCRALASRQRWTLTALGLLRAGLGCLLGVALSAVQILPFVYFSTHYINFEGRSFGGAHLDPSVLASTVVPSLLGTPDMRHSVWAGHPLEAMSFIGMAPLVLVVAAILGGRRTRAPRGVILPLTIITLVLATAVYAGGPVLRIIQVLPAMSSNPIARARAVLGLLVAVLAALGLAVLSDGSTQADRGTPRVWAGRFGRLALAAYLVVPIALAVHKGAQVQDPDFAHALLRGAAIILGLSVLGSLVALRGRWPLVRALAVAAVVVVAAVPGIRTAHWWWPLSDEATFYPTTQTHSFLAKNLGEDRYANVDTTMLAGTSSAYQLRALTGHTFTTPQWQALWNAAVPGFFDSATMSSIPPESLSDSATSPALDRFAVKYLIVGPGSWVPGTRDAVDGTVGSTLLKAGSTLESADGTGPVNGVQLTVLSQSNLPEHPGVLTARLVSQDGEVLATTSSRISGVAGNQTIAFPADAVATTQGWHLELSLAGTDATITLGSDDDGHVIAAPIRPASDGLRVVRAGEATIVERTTALERVRWASTATSIPDEGARIAALLSRNTPPTTVVLDDTRGLHTTSGASTATVRAKDVSVTDQRIDVTATGAGWVVVADQLLDDGWSATLDGEPVDLLEAEQAGGAVYVPTAGHHVVELRYRAPMLVQGAVLSTVSVLVVLASLLVLALRHRRRRALALASTDPAAEIEEDAGIRTERARSGTEADDPSEASESAGETARGD